MSTLPVRAAASPSTRTVRAGIESDTAHGAVIPPLHLSVNFTFEEFARRRKYDYTRSGNPTRDLLAAALADLECGAGAVVTSTGMSAVGLILNLLKPGDLLLAPHDCYGGTFRLFSALARRGHFEVAFVEQTNAIDLTRALARRPRLVWIETPANPLLRIVNIREVAAAAHAAGALVAADNTFLSPILQKPLALGADFVVHSTTKYINGHSDVVGGAVISRDAALAEELAWWANCTGVTGAPFDSYLTLRGLRTLHARMRIHCENASRIADFLQKHPAVANVYYPGLASHPGHAIAQMQQSGFGGMVTFEIHSQLSISRFADSLQYFSLAESLGGVESLVAHPATMTHSSMTPEARARAGISDRLLRLSAGIEDAGDLIADLSRAFDAATDSCSLQKQSGVRAEEQEQVV